MCVIIVKKKGVEMPSERELRLAYEYNPHGCGFVSSNGLYWRGMDFEEFLRRVGGVSKEDACIIHFRIATHGSIGPKNCHPFRGELNGEPVYFAHNGVLPIRPKGDVTDSEAEFRDVLLPAMGTFGYRSSEFSRLVARVIHTSKFAFMYRGEARVFGRWFRDSDGLLWSNLNHRSYDYRSFAYGRSREIYV